MGQWEQGSNSQDYYFTIRGIYQPGIIHFYCRHHVDTWVLVKSYFSVSGTQCCSQVTIEKLVFLFSYESCILFSYSIR